MLASGRKVTGCALHRSKTESMGVTRLQRAKEGNTKKESERKFIKLGLLNIEVQWIHGFPYGSPRSAFGKSWKGTGGCRAINLARVPQDHISSARKARPERSDVSCYGSAARGSEDAG